MIKIQNILFIHDLHSKSLPSVVVSTFDIEFSHSYNTRANQIGLINHRCERTSTYGLKSIRYQSISSWIEIQRVFPSTQLVSLKKPKLKKCLNKYFISLY